VYLAKDFLLARGWTSVGAFEYAQVKAFPAKAGCENIMV
jgi:hypothetical protein